MPHSFQYVNGSLQCEQVELSDLAEAVGTPVFVYSKKTILDDLAEFRRVLAPLDTLIVYAVKACSNKAILNLFAKQGIGYDVVSGGELWRAINAGGNPKLCTYAGVGKTEPEIRYAIEQEIYCFNCESLEELREINRIAADMGVKAPIAIRVNPHVDARTHKYITTGTKESKFGIDITSIEEAYATVARELPHLQIKGLQMHIGSQLTDVAPFVEAIEKAAPIVRQFKELYGIEFFSIGGGVGIVYEGALASGQPEWWAAHPDHITLQSYADAIIPLLQDLGVKIVIEPGRRLVGNACAMVTRCLYEKQGAPRFDEKTQSFIPAKLFKMIDAGMNDLIRPALYQGHHEFCPVKENHGEPVIADLVGPICESGDFQATDRLVADVKPGELLAGMSAGAYGFTMSSTYNSRPLAAEVLVDGDQWHIIRRRQTLEEIITGESIPEGI